MFLNFTALMLAGEKYPDDALQWDDETIDDIKAHYEYLMNHEDILAGLEWLSKRSKEAPNICEIFHRSNP